VLGSAHHARADHSTICGGSGNATTARYAAVYGGVGNRAGGQGAAVNGGTRNVAEGDCSSVSGGEQNHAVGAAAAISGGLSNQTRGPYSWAGGVPIDQFPALRGKAPTSRATLTETHRKSYYFSSQYIPEGWDCKHPFVTHYPAITPPAGYRIASFDWSFTTKNGTSEAIVERQDGHIEVSLAVACTSASGARNRVGIEVTWKLAPD
jgi:hypothetical protein